MKTSKLTKLLAKQTSESSIQDLIEGLLTPRELTEINQRITIVELLKAGIPHHQIARKLNVGVGTVTRGSKELQQGHFAQIKADQRAWRISLNT